MTTETITALCTAVSQSRWTAPADPMNTMGDWTPDPGPYTVGDTIDCTRCGTTTTVTKTVTSLRSAGTQYVAHLAPHPTPDASAHDRLRTTVRDTLTALQDGTITAAEEAEDAIMNAVQRYAPSTTPTPAT